jgi:hypothetical protein
VYLIDLEDEISKSKTPDAKTIDQFSLNIGKLRSVVTEAMAIGCVPAYDQRLCEEVSQSVIRILFTPQQIVARSFARKFISQT